MRLSAIALAIALPSFALAQAPVTDPTSAPQADPPNSGDPSAPSPSAATGSPIPAPTAVAAPSEDAEEDEGPGFTITARPGQGVTLAVGESYALTLRPRIQLRDTITVRPDVANEVNVKTLRLWIQGHVFSPRTRYGIQLAMGGNDFETGSASPIFDAYFDFSQLRDMNVRIGQFFVPFDRLRTIREFALQSVDRAVAITELTLDRDVGVHLYSNDLGGFEGKLGYSVGLFGGEGRNRFGAQAPGFLYTARFSYRPFGSFDEDSEGDLERRASPKLMLGAAFAYNQNAQRVRGTTGAALPVGNVDYLHFALDTSFKWRGFAFLGELVVRGSTTNGRLGTDTMGQPITQIAARGLGYVLQASYAFVPEFELWGRWDEVRTPWATDATLHAIVDTRGREIAGGVNYYLNGHAFKIQLDVQHAFGATLDSGTTVVRLQLDATF